MLDGRLARRINAGTRFGAELDSLVDAISFGVAPAMILYFLEFQAGGRFAWVICFIYIVAVTVRLARYNIIAHGKPASSWFVGLPSPAAGMTLAVYYPFSQTDWYQASVAYLNLQKEGLVFLTLALSALMVSNVRYPKFPGIGFRSWKGIAGTVFNVALLIGGLTYPAYVLFPLGMFFIFYGLTRAVILNLSERPDPLAPDAEPELGRPLVHGRTGMTFRAHIRVTPRTGLLDPQGLAVEHALARPRLRRGGQRPHRQGHRGGSHGRQPGGRRGPDPPDVRQAAGEPGDGRLPDRDRGEAGSVGRRAYGRRA